MTVPTVPATVVVPTIGRSELLKACLASLAACRPRPAETIVIDQSSSPTVHELVESWRGAGMRLLHSHPPGIPRALNLGMRDATHDVILRTDDDCTVAPDWVGIGWKLVDDDPDLLVTGRVLPGEGQGFGVPSIKTDVVPEVRTRPAFWLLYSLNMAVHRLAAADIGWWDEVRPGFRDSADDNDFCWRWTKSGRALRYEPSMVVWHHSWRSAEQLAARYVDYGRSQGAFYAKYLAAGDRSMIRYAGENLRDGLRAVAASVVRRRPLATDERWGVMRGLPGGFVSGWRQERRLGRGRRPGA